MLADALDARDRARCDDHAIDELVDERRVVICCGSGGVGKTTTAAVLALEGARRGRNACVVTIDPAQAARRTRSGSSSSPNTPTEIDREPLGPTATPTSCPADGCRR